MPFALVHILLIIMKKTFKALILNDYPGAPYVEWIKTGEL